MVVTILGRRAGIDTAGHSGASFDDVNTGMYYAPHIKRAAEMGIGNNKFAPGVNIGRQELTVILTNCTEKMKFTLR